MTPEGRHVESPLFDDIHGDLRRRRVTKGVHHVITPEGRHVYTPNFLAQSNRADCSKSARQEVNLGLLALARPKVGSSMPPGMTISNSLHYHSPIASFTPLRKASVLPFFKVSLRRSCLRASLGFLGPYGLRAWGAHRSRRTRSKSSTWSIHFGYSAVLAIKGPRTHTRYNW